MAFSCHCVSNCRQHVGFKNKILNFALFLSPFVLQGTWYRTSQPQCKSQGRGCKTQADGCCLWMASLCDSNCITLNYGWNDPFLGWGYKSGSLKLPSPSLPFSLLPSLSASEFFIFFFFYDTHKNYFHPYSPPSARLILTVMKVPIMMAGCYHRHVWR